MQVSLNKAAEVLDCHPRTVLRAITGEPHPYWSEGFNPDYAIKDLAKGLRCNKELLEGVFRGEGKLLKPAAAAVRLNVTERTIRYRAIQAFIKCRGTVRFLQATIDLAREGVI